MNSRTANNSLMTITPYFDNGWMFDDERVGLVKEPFVSGVPELIETLVREIPGARNGFRLLFGAGPFPGHTHSLKWFREEFEGNWYRMEGDVNMEGWLCPALFHYFESAPEYLYIKAETIEI